MNLLLWSLQFNSILIVNRDSESLQPTFPMYSTVPTNINCEEFNSSFCQRFPSDSAILMAFIVALLWNNMKVSSNPSLWEKPQQEEWIKMQRLTSSIKELSSLENSVEVDLLYFSHTIKKFNMTPHWYLSGIKFETIYKTIVVWGFRGSSFIDTGNPTHLPC